MRSLHGVVVMVCLLLMAFMLHGCTPYIYGVPQPQWDQMTSGQRDETIRGYNERERIRERARQEEAVRQAREAEIRAVEARRQDELIRQRVEGIYAGTAGQFGDLIQVTLSGGQMMISWGYQNYQPVAFKIANGETRRLDVVSVSPKLVAPERSLLLVRYVDGMLLIDGQQDYWDRASRLVMDNRWRRGADYQISSNGDRRLHNVNVRVEVIPHLRPVMLR